MGVVILFVMSTTRKRGIKQLRTDLAGACRKQQDQARRDSSRIKGLVAVALGQLREQQAVEPLVVAMQNEDAELARVATAVLMSLGKAAIVPVSDAVGQNKVPLPLAMTVIKQCVETEEELLAAIQAANESVEFCKVVLDHEAVGEEVLNYVAAIGPIGVLPHLVAMERAQATQAQVTAQKRLQEEAERQRKDKEQEERRRAEERYDEESGPCYCRWQ